MKVVKKTGSRVRSRIILYKEFLQSLWLYGINSCEVAGGVLKVLEGLNHQVAIIILGVTVRHTKSKEWEWTPVAEELNTAGLCPIK